MTWRCASTRGEGEEEWLRSCTGSKKPRPRDRMMLSAALVLDDRVYSSLTEYLGQGLIGRRHTTNFHRPDSHLASLYRNESEILGIGNSSRIWKEFAGAAPRR